MRSASGDNEVTGVLLAGGRSERMGGKDKGLIEIGGKPMLAHAAARLGPQVGQVVISANADPAGLAFLGLPVVADMVAGHAGPLAGLHTALQWACRETPKARFVASAPADAPFLPGNLVARLKRAALETGNRSAIAASGTRTHPVFGLWDVALAGDLSAALAQGLRAVHHFAEAQASAVVDFPLIEVEETTIDPFFNVNTPAELEEARALLPQFIHHEATDG